MEFYVKTLGTTVALTTQYAEGKTIEEPKRLSVAALEVNNRPKFIQLDIEITLPASTYMAFVIKNDKICPPFVDGKQSFLAPVEWGEKTPKTRFKGQDNVDVIILYKDGSFVDIQCSITTRGGKFFLNIQQVWQGNVVRTRKIGSNEVYYTYVPTDGIHAYPGAAYSAVWDKMGEQVLGTAVANSATEQKSRVTVAEWNPPELSKEPDNKGYVEGVVRYFNMVTGTGHISDASGKVYFVHFSNILDVSDGAPPILLPMEKVSFRPGAALPGKSLCSVHSIKRLVGQLQSA